MGSFNQAAILKWTKRNLGEKLRKGKLYFFHENC